MKKLSEQELLTACLNSNRKAQKELYNRYSYELMGVCLRYVKRRQEAEDVLQEGFINIFESLHQYKGTNQLRAWMRKVMINTSLQYLRKQKKNPFFVSIDKLESEPPIPDESEKWQPQYTYQEMLTEIRNLPLGYRLVFNMFVIDRMPHKAIAKKLGISEGTSKSQLFKAKVLLKKRLSQSNINLAK